MTRQAPLAGIAYGLTAYVIWGFFPLYFRQLGTIAPIDILCHRTAWAFVFVALLLSLRRRWRQVFALFATPRHVARLAVAALLLTHL